MTAAGKRPQKAKRERRNEMGNQLERLFQAWCRCEIGNYEYYQRVREFQHAWIAEDMETSGCSFCGKIGPVFSCHVGGCPMGGDA